MTNLRKTQGEKFCKQIISELKTLNIPNAQFSIQFNEYDENDVLQEINMYMTPLDEETFHKIVA